MRIVQKSCIIGCFLLAWGGFITPAWSTDKGVGLTQKATPPPKPWWKNFSATTTLGTALGTGSFAPSESYRNHFVAQSLTMGLTYQIWKGLYVSGGWGFDIEYTQPDNSAGRRFFARDVQLAVGWRNPIKAIQKVLSHSINLNVGLPASLLSQATTQVLQLDLGLAASYNIKKIVTFGYSFGVTKGFHQYTSPIFNQGGDVTPSILLRQSAREATQLGSGFVPTPSSRNISWQLRNSLSISVNFHKTVSLSLSFSIFNAFKYATPDDALTPVIPTTQGDIKADTIGRVDFTMGDISIAWQPIKYLGFSLGAVSLQTPFYGDNRSLRVPFFNIATPNDNTTTFYLNMTGSI